MTALPAIAAPFSERSTRERQHAIAMRWFIAALALRTVAMVALHIYSLHVGRGGLYPFGTHDDIEYWTFAVNLSRDQPVPYIPTFYPVLLSWLFRLVGPSLIAGKLLNVFFGAMTVAVGVAIASELREERHRDDATAEHWSGFLLTFYPSLLFYSTQLLKDAIVVLLGMTALLFAIRFLRHARFSYAAAFTVAIFALFFFRFYTALVVVFSVLAVTLRFQRKWLIPSALAAAVVPKILGLDWFAAGVIGPLIDPAHLTKFRTNLYSIGGSAAGIALDYSSPLRFLRSYGYSFATAMFGPFPWQVSSAIHFVALPEAMVVWLLAPIWFWGCGRLVTRKLRSDALLLIFTLFLTGAVALFSDNIGANTRLRLMPWCTFFIFASLRLPAVRLTR